MTGSVVAFAGQTDPVSKDANNIWKNSCCTSKDAAAAKRNDEVPLNILEAEGWMLCDGRALSPHSYPELFAVLGYLYGRKDDDFLIPDYRGLFLRGVDAGSGMDPDAAKRMAPTGEGVAEGIGSYQCDALESHTHTYKSVTLSATSNSGNAAGQASSDEQTGIPTDPAKSSSETRPRNIAVNYIIKYR
nr:tail fiber protein [Pleionea sp. CnH1-48]